MGVASDRSHGHFSRSALQLSRLQHTVAYAYDRVPLYKRKFDEAGVHPSGRYPGGGFLSRSAPAIVMTRKTALRMRNVAASSSIPGGTMSSSAVMTSRSKLRST